jgi:endonuclease YncB( thermonuclease family)
MDQPVALRRKIVRPKKGHELSAALSRTETLTRTAAVCALLLAAALASPLEGAKPHDTLTGKVVAIADGDTLTVLDGANVQHKIRLAGIDAPEKKQAFGNRARQALGDKVFGKAVQCAPCAYLKSGCMSKKTALDPRAYAT